MDRVGEGLVILPSGSLKVRSNDTEYDFRQDNNFFYLSGFHESESLLILDANNKKSILFVQDKEPSKERWTGIRIGKERVKEEFDFDDVYNNSELDKIFPELLKDHKSLYFDLFGNEKIFKLLHEKCSSLKKAKGRTQLYPSSFNDANPFIERLRLIKDESEIEMIEKALEITDNAFKAAMAFTSPDKIEHEVMSLINYLFRKDNGNGPAYQTIVAGGNNGCVLHYIENDMALKDNQLVLIDAGAEYKNYASDITRTFPINGKFTKEQKEVYEVVLDALNQSVKISSPGLPFSEIHKTATKVITKGLVDLGILHGDPDKLIEEGKHLNYYPHGTSHWLGLDVHDTNPYYDFEKGEGLSLAPGMIFTVEPGIYLPEDDELIPEKYRGISIRIEDDILITSDGNINLANHIPKTIEEIEFACSQDYKQFI